MLRAMSFAQWKNDSSFDALVEWANELLAQDHRENLVSIVVLDEESRPLFTLADVDRQGFDYIVDRQIINRYSA